MVYTAISNDGLVVLFRRTGTTVGFLFGFGLLALVMAGNASADDRQPGDEQPLLGTVESVTGLLSPATGTAEPVLQPVASVVHTGVAVLAPVVQPIVEMVEPVVAAVVSPVISTVTPALAPVTTVTEPVLDPPETAGPPVDPVPTTPSPTDTASAVTDTQETAAPQQRSGLLSQPGPARSWAVTTSPAAIPGVKWWSDASHRDGGHTRAAFAEPARLSGSGQSDDPPGVLAGPVNAVLGGGSVGGSGGSHGADAAVSTPSYPLGRNDSSGRSPPGSIAGQPWFGYDDRDHPS
jgi:hypothetical protein